MDNIPSSNVSSARSTPPFGDPNEKSSIGSIIAVVIILIMLIIGGLYMYGKAIEERTGYDASQDKAEESLFDENGSVPETADLEADLNSSVEDSSRDMQELDAELQSGF